MSSKLKNLAVVILAACFIIGFSVWGILEPDDDISVSERRPLAEFPTVDSDSLLSGEFMEAFEKYSLDRFPLRDNFRTLKSLTSFYAMAQKDNNGIYIAEGHASKLEYPINIDSISYAVERFQYIYDKYFQDGKSNIYLSLIPDKNYFMASQNGYLSMDYEQFAEELKNKMSFARYIDITGKLKLSDYYATDAHWRQEKITEAAKYIAAEMGVELKTEYDLVKVDKPFFGVYYGQSALPLKADELYYLNNEVLNNCTVYDYEDGKTMPVYNIGLAEGNDPYELFLSGSKSLISIENPSATTDMELIIFRDSFGSSLAPLLCEGYSKITLVDIRYISPTVLDKFISFNGQDVLFIYSTSVLNNSVTIK